MRVLKIILFIYTIIVFALGSYLSWYELSSERDRFFPISYETYVFPAIFIIAAGLAVMYHAKSIRFYRKKHFKHLQKKWSVIYYIGAFIYNCNLMYITIVNVYSYMQLLEIGIGRPLHSIMITILTICIPAILGFLEIFYLKKRIDRLKKEHELKEDISSIGTINE